MSGLARAILSAAAIAPLVFAAPGRAERADRNQPTQLEANRMSADDARRVRVFEGNVVLTKGTITLRGDRIVVKVDGDGYQHATVTGDPVRFKQRTDPSPGRAPVWTEAEAQRVEIDERNERIELFGRAKVTRDQDEVRGEYMLIDQRSDFLSAGAGKGAQAAADARVRAVIQPKAPPTGTDKPPAR